jgi:type I restriction enzyme, S subunit
MSDHELEKSSLNEGDLLFGRRSLVEAGAGKCSIVTEVTEPTTFESSIIRARLCPKRCDPMFYYYWFRSHLGRGRIRSIVSGTNVKGIRGSDLKKLKVVNPDIGTQQRIVSHIKSYDELIENNRRRIALLEDAARLLYREWFVYFRFPGHEHVKIIDGLPEGWERRSLGSVLTLQRGFDLPVGSRVAGGVPVYGSTGIVGEHNVPKGIFPTLTTGRSGSLGTVCFVSDPCWPLNTSLWVKEFKAVSVFFAYFMLSNMNLAQFNSGASVPTLDRKVVHAAKVVLPTSFLVSLFDEQVEILFSQKKLLVQQNQKLVQARDLLLPRLMNGEIAV